MDYSFNRVIQGRPAFANCAISAIWSGDAAADVAAQGWALAFMRRLHCVVLDRSTAVIGAISFSGKAAIAFAIGIIRACRCLCAVRISACPVRSSACKVRSSASSPSIRVSGSAIASGFIACPFRPCPGPLDRRRINAESSRATAPGAPQKVARLSWTALFYPRGRARKCHRTGAFMNFSPVPLGTGFAKIQPGSSFLGPSTHTPADKLGQPCQSTRLGRPKSSAAAALPCCVGGAGSVNRSRTAFWCDQWPACWSQGALAEVALEQISVSRVGVGVCRA